MEWKNDVAIFLQVIEQFKFDVILKKYLPGKKILSVREYAQKLNVNPNTIVKVYDILNNEGLIVAKSTNGFYLTDNEEIINNLKPTFAEKYKKDFLAKMSNLGYTLEETINYLRGDE